jgi:hypothetical protein
MVKGEIIMSLLLNKSTDINCIVRSGFCGRGFFENEIVVGDYYIHKDDFCSLIEYFFTNTDLEENDCRKKLLKKLLDMKKVKGYNSSNERFSIEGE